MKHLRERYVGEVAGRYELERSHTAQWAMEEAALREALESIQPARLLDVPCGTGRFWPLYQALGIKAHGIDLSRDMLGVAIARGWLGVQRGDVFDLHGTYDVSVCFRLLNWMTREECVAALFELRSVTERAVIVSIGIGEGWNGRTRLHDWGVFTDAGLRVAAIRPIHSWGYSVVTAEPC